MPHMPSLLRVALITIVLVALLGGPWAYLVLHEEATRNFHVVERGVLYRSGQLSLTGFARIVRDHSIRTVISLRDGDQDADQEEEKYCRRWGITHVRVPPRKWWASKGPAPAEQGLEVFREVMRDPANHPVLIHCFAGVHRTGAFCAVYRMDFQGWTNEQALAEMRRIGYSTLDGDWDLLTFLEDYRPHPEKTAWPVSRTKLR
jgi:tyrosine-protein phosphatase SIW14